MLTALLHSIGIIDLLRWLRSTLSGRDVVEGGRAAAAALRGRFAAAARTQFWPWVLHELATRDVDARNLLMARQRERHEWRASHGRFNALSEEHMNEAFGRVFTESTDPEHRFTVFGEIARMNDADFEAFLDAVTNDGFERYLTHLTEVVLGRVWPQAHELDARASRALRWAAVGGAVFFGIYAFAEVSGWDAIHGALAIYLVACGMVAFWQWPTVVAGLSAFKPTRPAMEVVGAGFAAASLLLVLGIFVPLHLAPWQAQMASLVALIGLSAVAYWGFLKGMRAPMFSPKTVGATLAMVVILTAVWSLNERYDNVIGRTLTSVQNQVQGFGLGSSRAEAAEIRVPGCDSSMKGASSHTFVAGSTFSNVEKIPPHSEFRITADAPVEALFTDGSSYILSGDGCSDLGHHPQAHFRVRSVSGEAVHVSVATRSIK